ncbi:hypothetical protein [Williamsia sp. CHRR-6]|uniref:hypothetical protein n=1 Tax=Williamsia sp. CHRR-6 TaxID=2835871 RepID=UPI001BD968AC|nr:hypothetical protein [Williamsia sp. CHRR-6]MBT0567336.1 hypothetical protein [Williamsia sp. CHRR-6]
MANSSTNSLASTPNKAKRLRLVLTLSVSVLVVASACQVTADAPGDELTSLPASAVAVLAVGIEAEPTPRPASTYIIAFDAAGKVVGSKTGALMYSPMVYASKDRVVATTGDAVYEFTTGGMQKVSINENMGQAGAIDETTGTSTLWFNTAKPDGPATGYRNDYVVADNSAGPSQLTHGRFEGYVRSVSQCGDRAYVVAEDINSPRRVPTRATNGFFTTTRGTRPTLLRTWEQSIEVSPVSRRGVCWKRGGMMVNLFSYPPATSASEASAVLTLVSNDLRTGMSTEKPVTVPGRVGAAMRDTLTLHNDRLYWINTAGEMLSVAADGSEGTVRFEWSIPDARQARIANVGNGIVAVVTKDSTPRYIEYSLVDGRTLRTVPLAWLPKTLTSFYSAEVLSVAAIPR